MVIPSLLCFLLPLNYKHVISLNINCFCWQCNFILMRKHVMLLFYWNALYISRNCHLSKLLFLWFKWPLWTTGLAFIFGWQRNKILGKRNVFYSASSHKLPKCTHDGQSLILIKTSKTIKICSEKLHVLNLKRIKCWVEIFSSWHIFVYRSRIIESHLTIKFQCTYCQIKTYSNDYQCNIIIFG